MNDPELVFVTEGSQARRLKKNRKTSQKRKLEFVIEYSGSGTDIFRCHFAATRGMSLLEAFPRQLLHKDLESLVVPEVTREQLHCHVGFMVRTLRSLFGSLTEVVIENGQCEFKTTNLGDLK